ASPEASAVVITSAVVEPARIVAASCTAVSGAVVAARAGIAAARVRGGIAAAAAGIAAARVGGGIAAARVGRGRVLVATAARERTAGKTAAGVPTASPPAALGQCGRRAKQHQERAKSKRRHGGFERYCLHCPIHENLQYFRLCNVQTTCQLQVFENKLLTSYRAGSRWLKPSA